VVAGQVRNAGAVFVGPYSPVSLGDYCAGSNHVLPTGGCACHSSGLSVQTFLKGMHIVEYTEAALAEVAHHVVALANAEDLPAHGQAVTARTAAQDEPAAFTPPAPIETPAEFAPPEYTAPEYSAQTDPAVEEEQW
jgi:histidinol dehydrogenase